MLFFSLCAGFYDLGYGLIGEHDGNATCKIANIMPKVSTYVWFSLKQGAVMMKTWINSIVMVLHGFVCILLSWMLYNDVSVLYLRHKLLRKDIIAIFLQLERQRNWFLWHKTLRFRTLPCILRHKLVSNRALSFLLTAQKYHCAIHIFRFIINLLLM